MIENDPAFRVAEAYRQTQQQYEHSWLEGAMHFVATLNAWPWICGCYMGIEQTMKHLSKMCRGGRLRGHDLKKLYDDLAPSERKVVDDYYRIYRSLYNFDSDGVPLNTADEYIRHISKGKKGYEVWRYLLLEPDEEVPKIHVGSMFEIWRALVALVERKPEEGHGYDTLDIRLEEYILKEVWREAYTCTEWQAACRDDDTKFSEVQTWLQHNGRLLQAGIDLFNRLAQGTEATLNASPLWGRVLFRAAEKAEKAVRSPSETHRKIYSPADIAMFHHRIRHGGLSWNKDKRVFESNPPAP